MDPTTRKQATLTVESSLGEQLSRSMVLNLQNNLNTISALKAEPGKAETSQSDSLRETRSDGMLLYTLLLTFVQSGAAKSLIDAVRALFSSSRDKSLRVKLRINNKEISITADNLNNSESHMLVNMIQAELEKL